MELFVSLWPLWLACTLISAAVYFYRRAKQRRLKAQFVVAGTIGCLTTVFMVATIISCILTAISLVLRVFWKI